MIKFEYTHPNDTDYEGLIKVSVDTSDMLPLRETQFPLQLMHKSLSGEVTWNAELQPGWWSAYSMLTYTTLEVIDAEGNEIMNWKWDPFLHGDFAHQAFEIWARNNRGANGVAIGTHNGMTGEWVGPLNKGLIKGTLIEASDRQFYELRKFYGKKPWIECRQELVTPAGGYIDFYEGGEGWTNSVVKESTSKYVDPSAITSTVRLSISVNGLLSQVAERGKIEWIHLDVEGLDEELIRSINPEFLPSVLIYEHENTTEEVNDSLFEYLRSLRYAVTKSGRNVFCQK